MRAEFDSMKKSRERKAGELSSEILILPDGLILVHNLTPVMAAILNQFNPDDHTIKPRVITAKLGANVADK